MIYKRLCNQGKSYKVTHKAEIANRKKKKKGQAMACNDLKYMVLCVRKKKDGFTKKYMNKLAFLITKPNTMDINGKMSQMTMLIPEG